jgi:hypothetical protein
MQRQKVGKSFAGNMKIIKMTPICEENLDSATHILILIALDFYSKVDKLVVFFEK